jgi:hypothetical protein
MSYFRSYFEKNNTILKDSQVNTAKNPNTELIYGSTFSKFLFKVDFTELKNRVESGYLVVTTGTTHTLHITNTIFGDETLLRQENGKGRSRTTSFDLVLFKIPEFWDEGVGFDYEDQVYDFTDGNRVFDERPSNWFNRTTLNSWTSQGVYDTDPEIVKTIHFDNGNEDINVDITDYVNGVIVSGNTDHGLGLAFAVLYQDLESEVDQSVAFFTKYTQTFFEPYVESFFDDKIHDDRQNFYEKTNQNLYLYVTKESNNYDLDHLPTVDITDSNGNVIIGLSDLPTTKVRKGVYKVSLGIDGALCDGKRFYFDVWKNLAIDGVSLNNVTQKFVPKPVNSKFNIGENDMSLYRYAVQFFGVRLNEKIKRGEIRKIVATFKSIDLPKNVLLDEVYYAIYIKEGKTVVNVIDWTKMDKTNENSFMLDTTYLIPREYYLEIKGRVHNEFIYYKDVIKFEIVSEK